MANVLWSCPNGCPAVRGPSKPRRNACVRYCLTCSLTSAKLVERTAPALERKREQRTQKRVAKLVQKREKAREQTAAYYTVHGVNLLDKLVEFTRLPVFKEEKNDRRLPIYKYVPELQIRRCADRPTSRYGFCRYNYGGRALIHISLWPGVTLTSVLETLLHETVHAHVGSTRGSRCHHGPLFKAILRRASEEAFGVKPKLKTRYHGEITKLVDASKNGYDFARITDQAAASVSQSASSQNEEVST